MTVDSCTGVQCVVMDVTDNHIEPPALGLGGNFQIFRGGRRRQQHPWKTCGSTHVSALQGEYGANERRLPTLDWLWPFPLIQRSSDVRFLSLDFFLCRQQKVVEENLAN